MTANRPVTTEDLRYLIQTLCLESEKDPDGLFYCGACNREDGSNWEWRLMDMIFETSTGAVITPCCGVEAAGALISYEKETR